MVLVENLTKTDIADDVKHEYFYRMFKSNISVDSQDGKIEVQSYGIEVERQDVIDGCITNIERDYVNNISPQRHKVHNLLKMLCDNLVSPIHLIDVIGENIDYYIVDFDNVIKEAAY